MRIAVLQPSYLPWLGYLDQVAAVDAFVIYDDVQFDKNGWRNRNRIRAASPQGWHWLTIPVRQAMQRVCDIEIDRRCPWQRKHAQALRTAYARAPYFALFEEYIAPLYRAAAPLLLVDAAIASMKALLAAFGIGTPLYRSSELAVRGDRNERLIAICRHFGAREYLSGIAARTYLDVAQFMRAGVAVQWQTYTPPHGSDAVTSHLSAIDTLLWHGPSRYADLRAA